MKRSLLLAAGITAAISIPAVAQAFWWGGDKKADAPAVFKLNGAGATFPAPLYNSWFQSFNKETGNQVTIKQLVVDLVFVSLLPRLLTSVPLTVL